MLARRSSSSRPLSALLAGSILLLASCGGASTTDSDSGSAAPATAAPATTAPVTTGTSPPPATELRTTTTAASPTTEAAPALAATCSTASWPLERRAAALVFATITTADRAQLRRAVDGGAGGIFISTAAVPLLTGGDVRAAVDAASPRPLVAIDEEGGRVQRLASVLGALPSARRMHATMTPAQIRALAAEHGAKLRRLGVTMDFAPVVDVSSEPDRGAIGDRSFSADPGEVTADAVAFAQGLQAAGVQPVFKHFPGHGRASGDSHLGTVTTPPLAQLEAHDLVPYRDGLAQVPGAAVMTGHLVVPGLTDGQPASVSPAAVTGLLRHRLGFGGLVITDDLGGMKGITDVHSTREAAVRSVLAGSDLVLVPTAEAPAVVAGLVGAVQDGRLPEAQLTASADRVLAATGCA